MPPPCILDLRERMGVLVETEEQREREGDDPSRHEEGEEEVEERARIIEMDLMSQAQTYTEEAKECEESELNVYLDNDSLAYGVQVYLLNTELKFPILAEGDGEEIDDSS